MKLPVVAIVGRPNVGKSTLLNRLAGKRLALVDNEPGVTRDRIYQQIDYKGLKLTLVDTGGLDVVPTGDALRTLVEEQSRKAIREADLLMLVVDGTQGLLPGDWRLAEELRSLNKPVMLVVNKLDNLDEFSLAYDFYQLGLGDPVPVSGLRGLNMNYLREKLLASLGEYQLGPKGGVAEQEPIKVALIGRPNVGKSSIFNRIVGEERAIVSDLPGTTRDTIDTVVRIDSRTYQFIDTAGIRRRTHIPPGLEQHSTMRALSAVKRSDVVVVVVQALEGITSQDNRLLEYVTKRAEKGLVLVANKCDLLDPRAVNSSRPSQLYYIPIVLTSARTGFGMTSVLAHVAKVYSEWCKLVPTPTLNSAIKEAVSRQPLPLWQGKKVRLLYVTQIGTSPPRFLFFANHPEGVPISYRRYLENQLRQRFGFMGTPLGLEFRTQKQD